MALTDASRLPDWASPSQLRQGMRELITGIAHGDLQRLPMLRRLPAERRQAALLVALLVCLLLAVASAFLYTLQLSRQGAWIETSTRLQMLSQRYAKSSQQAVLGNRDAFAQLKEARDGFDTDLKALIHGGEATSASPDDIQPLLAELQTRWTQTGRHIQTLLGQRDTLIKFAQAVHTINQRNTELLDLTQQLQALIPVENRRQLDFVAQQAIWTQRMAKDANALLAAPVINPENAYQLGEDVKTFREVLDGLAQGNPSLGIVPVRDALARDKLQELVDLFTRLEAEVQLLLEGLPRLVEAKTASRAIYDEADRILTQVQTITTAYQGLAIGWWLGLTLFFSLLALLLLILYGWISVADARRRAEESARENKRNQDAILRLLNEMGDLAEGDLTVQATVTEDITGAIADSVNYAIDELRMLVNNINRATAQVTEATDAAKQVSDALLAAAERQSQQIARTGEAINAMTRSILNVSENAAESARVADQSLATARKGGDAVREGIAGMNQLRDQIQETAKRIKRLGESSQEIGEIVELIGDITEQTNVLALNAAIQAAAAGEAGRGFSVVAEEVQRLAERSANATRRIGAIVKAIQGDTQDAVHAMEVSTQAVVQGTALSDAAGHALQEIESVSGQLARLIQDISAATQDQVRTAEGVAQNMQEILQVTRQTSDGARRSAQSMDQLTALAEELKVSVSGFKL